MIDDDALREKIRKNYCYLFRSTCKLAWDTAENNKLRAEKYGITKDTTSITIPNVTVSYVDKQGEIRTYQAESITASLIQNGQPCEALDHSLRSQEEYAIRLSVMSHGEEYVHDFNLRRLQYLHCPFERVLAYWVDTTDKTKSTVLRFIDVDTCQYLNVFVYIVTENNLFFEEPEEKRNTSVHTYSYIGPYVGSNTNAQFSFVDTWFTKDELMKAMGFHDEQQLKQYDDLLKMKLKNFQDHYYGQVEVGEYGERLTEEELMEAQLRGYDGKIIKNLYVPKEDGGTAEIDVIYICRKGIVVIESKNYSGWIFGNEQDELWTATLRTGAKNRFYNPIMQNWYHIRALIDYLGDGADRLPMHSVIAFSERCSFKKLTVYSQNVQIIHRNKMIEALKNIWEHEDCLSEKQIEKLCTKLSALANADEATKKAHVDNVKRYN